MNGLYERTRWPARFGVAAVLLLALVGQTSAARAEAVAARSTDAAYSFPLLPNTPAWAALKTHDDMLRVTEVPLSVLRSLSTSALVSTVLNYPLYDDMLAFDSPQQGFDKISSRFDGLAALLDRPDAGQALLARYQAMDPGVPRGDSLLEQGLYDARFRDVEILLAQDRVRQGMTAAEVAALVVEAQRTLAKKVRLGEVYGLTGEASTDLVIGRAVVAESASARRQVHADPALTMFLSTGSLAGRETKVLAGVEALAGPASAHPLVADSPITVHTPKGTAVAATQMNSELTAAQIAADNNYVASTYPSATRETNASRKYNCHSYAWYSQSTSNNVWINSPGDDKFWLDGSYLPSYNVGKAGRKVSYRNDDHSAITVNAVQFRSKWGQLPVMLHNYNYCPYNSSALYYYEHF